MVARPSQLRPRSPRLLAFGLPIRPILIAFCACLFAAPAFAADPGDANPGDAGPGESGAEDAADQDEHIERQLDAHGRRGSREERRLKRRRDLEKKRLIESRRKEKRDEVIIIGSSSVNGALGRRLERGFEQVGFKAVRWGRSASGLSRLDYYDWFDTVVDLPIGAKTAGVLVYMGVNDPQGIWLYPGERKTRDKWIRFHHKKEWNAKYVERVVMLIDALCNLGVPRVAILTPVDVSWSRLQQRLIRIRRLQIEGARKSICGFAVSGSGDALHLAEKVPASERRRVRDGYHLTGFGGDIIWDRIKYRVTRRFRGQPWLLTPEVPDVRELERRRRRAAHHAARAKAKPIRRAPSGSAGGRSAPRAQ